MRFLLYSNLFIALCACAQTLQTQMFLQGKGDFWLLGLVFFATLLVYNLHRLVGLDKIAKVGLDERFRNISAHRPLIYSFFFLSLLLITPFFFFLQRNTQIALFLAALPSLGYVLPFWKGGKRLRDFSYLKIFLIALVWPFVTVLLPHLQAAKSLDWTFVLLYAERSLFTFIIALPFDIRDLEIEQKMAVRTIPARIGVAATIRLSLLLSILWGVLIMFIYPFSALVFLWSSVALTVWLISRCIKPQGELHYALWLDGMMLLQGMGMSLYYLLISGL